MKVIYCECCGDLVALRRIWSVCSCGGSKGRLLSTQAAVFTGRHAVPLVIPDGPFNIAKSQQPNLVTSDPAAKNSRFLGHFVAPNDEYFRRVPREALLHAESLFAKALTPPSVQSIEAAIKEASEPKPTAKPEPEPEPETSGAPS